MVAGLRGCRFRGDDESHKDDGEGVPDALEFHFASPAGGMACFFKRLHDVFVRGRGIARTRRVCARNGQHASEANMRARPTEPRGPRRELSRWRLEKKRRIVAGLPTSEAACSREGGVTVHGAESSARGSRHHQGKPKKKAWRRAVPTPASRSGAFAGLHLDFGTRTSSCPRCSVGCSGSLPERPIGSGPGRGDFSSMVTTRAEVTTPNRTSPSSDGQESPRTTSLR